MKKQLIFFVFTFLAFTLVAQNKGFIHPGALHTQADFDRIKAQIIANEPSVVQDYAKLTNNSHSSSSYGQAPQSSIIRGGGVGENYSRAMNDAAAAYQNALRWKIGGDTKNADKAVEIMNGWANTCKFI